MGTNVADLLATAAAAEPERIALSEAATGRTVTWAALDDLADRVAQGLSSAGMVAGYRVLLAVDVQGKSFRHGVPPLLWPGVRGRDASSKRLCAQQ